MLKIYFSADNELAELDAIERCSRVDVLVEIDGKFYLPYIIMLSRLEQEVHYALENGEIYLNEESQIIVKSVDKQSIIEAIVYHYKHKYFDAFHGIELQKYYKNNFVRLCKINNWILVYSEEETTSNK